MQFSKSDEVGLRRLVASKKQACVGCSAETWEPGLQESVSLIASKPFRETESYQATLKGGGVSLIGVEELTIFIIPASCTAPVTASGSGVSGVSAILLCDGTLSRLHWNVLMLDVKQSRSHLGRRRSLILQSYSSAKREMKFWCVVCECVSGDGGKWLVINTSDTPRGSSPHSSLFFLFWGRIGLILVSSWSPSYRATRTSALNF